MGEYHRFAVVSRLHHQRINGDSPKERNPCGFGQFLPASVAKYLIAFAIIPGKIAHVFNDAQHRHPDFTEHFQTLSGINKADFLRRGNHHRGGKRYRLGEGQLGIPGAGWKINHHVIQVTPMHVGKKLGEGSVNHGPAPNNGFFRGNKEPHGHKFDAIPFQG